jgi:predicted MFS family arabinose efflux permease
VVANRVDRRRLLIVGDGLAAAVLAALVMSLAAGVRGVAPVYAAAILLAMIAPFYHPAIQALVPALADGDAGVASAQLQTVDSVVSVAGPVAGGGMIVMVGVDNALLIDAGTFAISALAIATIRLPRLVRPAWGGLAGVRADLAEGLRFVSGDRLILTGALLFAAANFAVFLVQANLIFYLTGMRHFAATSLGLVFSADGVGALIGALIAPGLERRWRAGTVILVSTIAAGAATLPLLWAASPVTVSLVCALEAACGMVTAVTWFSLRIRRVPESILGRVVALTRMLAYAAIPLAAPVGGVLLGATDDFGPLILASGGLQVLLGVGGMWTVLNERAPPVRPEPAAPSLLSVES